MSQQKKQKWARAKPKPDNRLTEFMGVLTQAKDAIEKAKAVYEDELEFLEKAAEDLAETSNA